MQTEEIFNTSVVLLDPIGAFDNPGVIMGRIREEYKHKCKNGYFILDILELVRVSECMLDINSRHGEGRVDVIVKVLALRYAPGDIVSGCEVIEYNKSSGLVTFLKWPLAGVVVNGPYNSALRSGDKIIIIIKTLKCGPGSASITCQAELFGHSAVLMIYKINPAEVRAAEVAYLVERAKHIKQALENLKTRWQDVFASSYSGVPLALPEGSSTVQLIPLSGSRDLHIARDNRANITECMVTLYPESYLEEPRDNILVKVFSPLESTAAYAELLWRYINMSQAIIDAASIVENPTDPSVRAMVSIMGRKRLARK